MKPGRQWETSSPQMFALPSSREYVLAAAYSQSVFVCLQLIRAGLNTEPETGVEQFYHLLPDDARNLAMQLQSAADEAEARLAEIRAAKGTAAPPETPAHTPLENGSGPTD